MKRETVKVFSGEMKAVTAFLAKAESLGGIQNVQQFMDKLTPEEIAWIQPSGTGDSGVRYEPGTLAGVEVELITPDNLSGDAVIFYIHGGAFTYGDIRTSRPVAAMLAKAAGLRTWTITYSLAPQHKFPKAVNEAFGVYRALLEKYPGTRIAVVGESAGATLSMTTFHKIKEAGLRMPSSITLYSHPGNFTEYVRGGKCEANEPWLTAYSGGESVLNPLISTNLGDLTGCPPLKVVADSAEYFTADSIEIAEKADALGTEVELQLWEGAFHAFPAYPTAAKDTPETAQVIEETARFILGHLG